MNWKDKGIISKILYIFAPHTLLHNNLFPKLVWNCSKKWARCISKISMFKGLYKCICELVMKTKRPIWHFGTFKLTQSLKLMHNFHSCLNLCVLFLRKNRFSCTSIAEIYLFKDFFLFYIRHLVFHLAWVFMLVRFIHLNIIFFWPTNTQKRW